MPWAYAEIPFLYPMAEKLPMAGSPTPQATQIGGTMVPHYRSLYEEGLAPGFRNIKMDVAVRGYQLGTGQGSFQG